MSTFPQTLGLTLSLLKVCSKSLRTLTNSFQRRMASLSALSAWHFPAAAEEIQETTLRASISPTPSLISARLPVAKHSKQVEHSEFIKSDITERMLYDLLFNNSFTYECDFCDMVLNTNKALARHNERYYKWNDCGCYICFLIGIKWP